MEMDMITPTLSEIRGGTSEARTLQETGGSLDSGSSPSPVRESPAAQTVSCLCTGYTPRNSKCCLAASSTRWCMGVAQVPAGWTPAQRAPSLHKDHSSAIFSGFAGFLAILLTTMIFYGLWNWNKLKKRQVPYFRVTIMPLLTLSRPRQGAKNIYDSLPQRQEDLGRRQSRSNRIFSTESLLSRHSESPPSEHVLSQVGNVLWVHRDHYPANGYTVGIYDNATGLQMRGDLTPSAHYVNVTATRDCLSISSEDSRDYINVPTAGQIAETLLASANATPTNSFAPPSAQKLELTEEREQGCGNASDRTSFWSPRSESDDPPSDEESSSETSNDYVNMAGLNLEAIRGKQPWMVSQCYRDYENVPSAHASGNRQRAEEEVTSSNTDHVEGRTDGPGTHVQFVMQSGRFVALGDYVTYPPSAQKETSQMKHGEERPNEASDDYENVLAANFGDVDPKGPDA